jgi:hypothetical protein
MRLFQNANAYAASFAQIRNRQKGLDSFAAEMAAFLYERLSAVHLLAPVLESDASTFLTFGNETTLQRRWAKENGLRKLSSNDDILLAQLEAHRTEIFYDLAPNLHGPQFVKRLPGCIKSKIAWYAAPGFAENLTAYDLVVSNFPRLLESYRLRGCKVAQFFPAFDPVMDEYAKNVERPIDVVFVGTYSRQHSRRTEILEVVAQDRAIGSLAFHLNRSRATRIAELPLIGLLHIGKYGRPATIRRISKGPIFGRDLYKQFSRSKIVLNVAIDVAGAERGNMRCFEALGCGALLLSDAGEYPEGILPDETFVSYESTSDVISKIRQQLAHPQLRANIAARGHDLLAANYDKARQWHRFLNLAE